MDASGNLFGVTRYGGASEQSQPGSLGDGMAWEISSAGAYTDLLDFGFDTYTSNPGAQIVLDSSGDIFGTCQNGSSGVQGAIFEFEKTGTTFNYHEWHGFIAGREITYTDGK